jgi:hypothetical protein
MKKAIDDNTRRIEDLQTVNELTNRVAEAIETTKQQEIDELSNINDSINNAKAELINQLQQQIAEERAQRDQAKMEQEIADKQ